MGTSWMGCLAEPEVPWIWSDVANCATFADVVLSCDVPEVQMCSRCVPVCPVVLVSFQHLYMLLTVMLMCGRCIYI